MINIHNFYIYIFFFSPEVTILGFKRGKSLKDLLVKAKLPTEKVSGKSDGCQGKRCGICPNSMATASKFSNSLASKEYDITSNLDCNSKNVVYFVQCKVCNIQYVTYHVLRNTVEVKRYLK